MAMVPFTKTDTSIVVVINGSPQVVLRDDPRYVEVLTELKGNADEAVIEAILAKPLPPPPEVDLGRPGFSEVSLEIIPGATFMNNKLVVEGLPDNEFVNNKARSLHDEGFSLIPLARFLRRLALNPSFRIRRDLLEFLEVGKLPLREDGRFVAYKRVQSNYLDIHSGRFDNSVGQVLVMDRQQVDDDPTNTCSYGFHVCSHSYLAHFGSFRRDLDRAMACAVAPEHVVSIPVDYNNTKMRVCQYEVVAELEPDKWVNNAGLSDTAMYLDDSDEIFGIFSREGGEDEDDAEGGWNFEGGHPSLEAANRELDYLSAHVFDQDTVTLQIRNLIDDTVLVERAPTGDTMIAGAAGYRVEAVKDGTVVAWALDDSEEDAVKTAIGMRAARPFVAIVRVLDPQGDVVATR